jgi:hypothetical protein
VGSNGWQYATTDPRCDKGSEWTKVVFLQDPDGGDSTRETFVVRFAAGQDTPSDTYVAG